MVKKGRQLRISPFMVFTSAKMKEESVGRWRGHTHVEAPTDMDLWDSSKSQFDGPSERDPEVLDFLTDLIADRFDSKMIP